MKQHVAGLDVAVHDPVSVRVIEGLRHVRRETHGVIDGELTFSFESFPKGLPFHVRHHVEEKRVRLARIEERQNMWVLQVRRRLDLGQEALGSDDRGELGLEDLQRDAAMVLEVFREKDRRHPTLAELSLDDVATLEGRVQAGDVNGAHGWPNILCAIDDAQAFRMPEALLAPLGALGEHPPLGHRTRTTRAFLGVAIAPTCCASDMTPPLGRQAVRRYPIRYPLSGSYRVLPVLSRKGEEGRPLEGGPRRP